MPILLCVATEMEIQPVRQWITNNLKKEVTIVITGVGLTAAAYSITKSVLLHQPSMVLQVGIAGVLNEDLGLGSVVAVRNECIGDLGVEENGSFRSIFDLELLQKNESPWDHGVLPNDNGLLRMAEFPMVNSITVNEISTNKNRIQYYRSVCGADIESMEGAALHFVCRSEKIPFLQVRSLSNFAGERNKSQWKMEEALFHLHEALPPLILKLLNT